MDPPNPAHNCKVKRKHGVHGQYYCTTAEKWLFLLSQLSFIGFQYNSEQITAN